MRMQFFVKICLKFTLNILYFYRVKSTREKRSKSEVEGWDRKQGIKPSKHDIFKKTKMLRCKGTYAGQVSIVIGIVEEKWKCFPVFNIYIHIGLVAMFGKTTIYIYIYIYGSEDGGNLLSIKKEECTGWNIHTSWVKRQQYFQSHKYMSWV